MKNLVQLACFCSLLSGSCCQFNLNPDVVVEYRAMSLYSSTFICRIKASTQGLSKRIQDLIEGGSWLFNLQLVINGRSNIVLQDNNDTTLYKPLQWIRTKGQGGTELLILKKNLLQTITITTSTLGIRSDDVTVNITDIPKGCLSELSGKDYEILIRDFLLHDFMGPQERRSRLEENERICNMHTHPNNGEHMTSFYECCHVSDDEIKCKKLIIDTLLNILLVCLLLFQCIAVMFAPMLIPKSYFKEKFRTCIYEHYPKVPITILAKTKSISKRGKESAKTVSLSKVCPDVMPKFESALNQMKEGIIYKLHFSKIEFHVKTSQLVAKSRSPISIFNSLYESLVLCRLRKKTSMMECCKRNIFGYKKCVCIGRQCTWYKCLRGLMNLLFKLMLCLPWIARILIIYHYEHGDFNRNNSYSATAGIDQTSYRFSYLTPVHIAFIICYIILLGESALLGVVSKHVTRMLRMVIRKCFQDMKSSSRAHVTGWFIRLLIKPLTHMGIYGLFLMPFHFVTVIPFSLVVMTMYFLPTFNIVLRLILYSLSHSFLKNNIKIVKYRQGTTLCQLLFSHLDFEYLLGRDRLLKDQLISTTRSRIIQIPATIICLISVFSFAFLTMEYLVFFFEYIILTMIGIILNATFAIEYVSVLVMVIIYGRECFCGVTKKYSSFNSDIHEYVLGKLKKEMKVVAVQEEAEQCNTAFTLPVPSGSIFDVNYLTADDISITEQSQNKELTERAKDDKDLVSTENLNLSLKPDFIVKDGIPKWKTRQLILFLDRKDISFLTEKFFFQMVNMPHSGGPGNLPANVLSALAQFIVIMVFLLFVILIVMIFGSEYNVSDLNQMIATLLTGFLPLLVKIFIFKPDGNLSVDTENVNFQNSFENVVRNYRQSWDIADLTVDKMEPISNREIKEANANIKEYGNEEMMTMIDEGVEIADEMNDEKDKMMSDIDLVINIHRHSHNAFHVV